MDGDGAVAESALGDAAGPTSSATPSSDHASDVPRDPHPRHDRVLRLAGGGGTHASPAAGEQGGEARHRDRPVAAPSSAGAHRARSTGVSAGNSSDGGSDLDDESGNNGHDHGHASDGSADDAGAHIAEAGGERHRHRHVRRLQGECRICMGHRFAPVTLACTAPIKDSGAEVCGVMAHIRTYAARQALPGTWGWRFLIQATGVGRVVRAGPTQNAVTRCCCRPRTAAHIMRTR